MVGKCVSSIISEQVGDMLRPVQLGFGSPGECEAAVHTTRHFLNSEVVERPKVLLKLDSEMPSTVCVETVCWMWCSPNSLKDTLYRGVGR